MKEKRSFGQILGRWTANLIVLSVTTCIWAVVLALAYKLISLILGVVM